MAEKTITEITRRAILDELAVGKWNWAGRLDDVDFLNRLYDLSALPSTDSRYQNASGDIYQHRVRNFDWQDDWVFTDPRFNLLHGDDEDFLRFLAATVHPNVRSDSDSSRELLAIYNTELCKDGWELVETKQISSRPVFEPRRLNGRVTVFEEPTGWQKVDRQMQEMRQRLNGAQAEEQCQAIGLLCREILISVAQANFSPARHPTTDGVVASSTDAKRMLDAIFATELKGAANEDARRHAKAAVDLALALQHKRTADFRTAALCAEGTLSVVNLLAIITGRRSAISH